MARTSRCPFWMWGSIAPRVPGCPDKAQPSSCRIEFQCAGGDERAIAFPRPACAPISATLFPGHDVYLQIDSDAWVQDWSAIDTYLEAASSGLLAITPQVDRSYNTIYKRPRRYRRTQNYKSFKWSYGWLTADRVARNPILNCGVFALPAGAPHWKSGQPLHRALQRRTFPARKGWPGLNFKLIEQTAMNYVVFAEDAPATFLPALCNWFCAHAAPKFDPARNVLVEPHAPYQPLGIIHLAGEDFQNRPFTWNRWTAAR